MNIKIDFASLSHKDALDLAILIEEGAKDRYNEFVDQMEQHHTLEAARFFREMIEKEAKHEADLTVWRHSLYPDEPHNIRRSMIGHIAAPDYDEVRAFMSARQAMEVALQCEIRAYDFFQFALSHVLTPEVRQLFEGLRDEAYRHQELVRSEMARLPPDSLMDPEAFIDEPTAQ